MRIFLYKCFWQHFMLPPIASFIYFLGSILFLFINLYLPSPAYSEIQAMAQIKASRFGNPYYYPSYASSMSNPTYVGQVSYVGMTSPPTPAGLSLFPYPPAHMMSAKVPSSPDSPPERPSSYPGEFTSFLTIIHFLNMLCYVICGI